MGMEDGVELIYKGTLFIPFSPGSKILRKTMQWATGCFMPGRVWEEAGTQVPPTPAPRQEEVVEGGATSWEATFGAQRQWGWLD